MEVLAGAPPHVSVGCRQEWVLAGRATDVGGPSEESSYECWFGCARRSVVACGLDGETGELFERRMSPDHKEILEWIRSLPGLVHVVYEAGPTGFGLARFLLAAGVDCVVAAPSKIQRPPGDRIKTDAVMPGIWLGCFI